MGTTSATAEYHVERIDGREVPKPLPKRLHWVVQTRVLRELLIWADRLNLDAGTEVDVLCGEDRLMPDVAVVRKDDRYEGGVLTDGAELAVEIMSPGQTMGELFTKCEKLHGGGTKHCWVLWPTKRKAWHYFAGELPVIVEDLLAAGEIRVPVQPLFTDLPDNENE